MVETPNHEYNAPAAGTNDWHKPLNENFETLDADVGIRDTEANKGNYEPKQGTKFEATDSGAVYYGNGSSWMLADRNVKTLVAQEIGSKAQAADAVVYEDGGSYVAMGQTGRVASGSDAGSVMQAAIDQVNANGGGKIVVGSGSYTLESGITVRSNITVQGSGPGSTIFNATGANQEWSTEGTVENVVLRDFGQDGNDEGGRTGVNITGAVDSWLINLDVRNVGARDGDSGSTPGLRVTGGTRSHIINCRVERSSSVSIEAAIGAQGCEIVNCVVKDGVYNSGAGFIHGISIEKSENCRIQNCYVEDSDSSGGKFSPALNANNADYATVSGNTVRNVTVGLLNANGPCYSNQYVNNNFYAFDHVGIEVKKGNSGAPKGTLIANNVLNANDSTSLALEIGEDATADVRNNLVYNITGEPAIRLGNTAEPVSFVGNVIRDIDGEAIFVNSHKGNGPVVFSNNYIEQATTSTKTNNAIVRIRAANGIMSGNAFGEVSAGDTNSKATVEFGVGAESWIVSNNYFRGSSSFDYGAALRMCGGIISNNIFDGKYISMNGNLSVAPPVVTNNTQLSGLEGYIKAPRHDIKSETEGYSVGGPKSGTYTGDGTTGRHIVTFTNPEHVIVEGSDGTLYDVHAQFGPGFEHNDPAGELSLTDGGFTISSSSGTDPNITGETYTFYAQ